MMLKNSLIERYNPLTSGDRPVRHIAAALGYVADSQHEAMATMRASLPRWLGPRLRGYRRADGKPGEHPSLRCRDPSLAARQHSGTSR